MGNTHNTPQTKENDLPVTVYFGVTSDPKFEVSEVATWYVVTLRPSVKALFARVAEPRYCVDADAKDKEKRIFVDDPDSLVVDQHRYMFVTEARFRIWKQHNFSRDTGALYSHGEPSGKRGKWRPKSVGRCSCCGAPARDQKDCGTEGYHPCQRHRVQAWFRLGGSSKSVTFPVDAVRPLRVKHNVVVSAVCQSFTFGETPDLVLCVERAAAQLDVIKNDRELAKLLLCTTEANPLVIAKSGTPAATTHKSANAGEKSQVCIIQ